MKPIQCEVVNLTTDKRECSEIAVRYFCTPSMKTCARCVKHAKEFESLMFMGYREIRRREFEAMAAVKEVLNA